MSEPVLDGVDIQGNILPGFRRAEEMLVGFSGTDPIALRRALAIIAPHLTCLATAIDHRDARKAFFLGNAPDVPSTSLWLNYALGKGATDALGLSSLGDKDAAFVAGMVPSRTGDSSNASLPDGSRNPAAPPNWVVGGPVRKLDLLLIFAADENIENAVRPIVDAVRDCGLIQIYSEVGRLLPEDKEHFGFQDGISNPGVLGVVDVGGVRRFVTTRYGVPDRNGVSFGKPGQPLLDPEQFLFDADELRNGSFLVFRRLQQDVAKFYLDTSELAKSISTETGEFVSPEAVRARIVGRWPSGQPLMRPVADPNRPESQFAINHFEFASALPELVLSSGDKVAAATGDPQVANGGRCPIWAHIRKVNPRDLPTDKGGADETRGFQMLRRGIPFGPQFDHGNLASPTNTAERGLLFLAYQTSISQQFETLNGDWMNTELNPSPGGFDLLVGQRLTLTRLNDAKPAMWFDQPTGKTIPIVASSQWVLPTGGAYLFAPSIGWTRKQSAGNSRAGHS
jgi:Dyp-type peroxidase family